VVLVNLYTVTDREKEKNYANKSQKTSWRYIRKKKQTYYNTARIDPVGVKSDRAASQRPQEDDRFGRGVLFI